MASLGTRLTELAQAIGSDIKAAYDSIAVLTGIAANKQDLLVSGDNIKTINGESVLGLGNIAIGGGGGGGLSSTEKVIVGQTTDANYQVVNSFLVPVSRYSKASLSVGRLAMLVVPLPNGNALLMGGDDGTTVYSTVQEYDYKTETLIPRANLPAPRNYMAGCLLPDGRVMVVGGSADASATTYQNSVWFYNPATDTWDTSAAVYPISIQGGVLAYVPYDNSVMYCGGLTSGAYVANCRSYSLDTGLWTSKAGLPFSRGWSSGCTMKNGNVLVAGGRLNGGTAPYTNAYQYIPASNTWELAMPSDESTMGDANSRMAAGCVPLPDGRVVLVWGQHGSGLNPTFALFTPGATPAQMNYWRVMNELGGVSPRTWVSSCLLGDGTILTAGGSNYGPTVYKRLIITPVLHNFVRN